MTSATRARKPRANSAVQKDIAATYNEFKQFEGRRYTGMKIGRGHKWYYDKGEWKEKKVTPDKWEFTYTVKKRRAGKAPEGSGAPVGTEYHWYIAAHQNVRKLNANDYSTSMTGLKFKVAHKRADNGKWSASDRAQRRRMIKLLEELIEELRQQLDEPARAANEPAAPASGDGRHRGKAQGNGRAARTNGGQAAHARRRIAAHVPSSDGKARTASQSGDGRHARTAKRIPQTVNR
jgi:hypothetical protein